MSELARWFNTFIEKIQQSISDGAQIAQNLSSSSRALATIAEGSKAAKSIAGDITDANQAVDEMTNAGSQVNASSIYFSDLDEKAQHNGLAVQGLMPAPPSPCR